MDVNVSEEIARDRKSVAEYAFDPLNDPKWIGGISEAELLTSRPVGEGTRVRRRARFLGKDIRYVLEVKRFIPERLMHMESVEGPFPMKVTYEFEDAPSGRTRAKLWVQGEAGGFYGFADLFMSPMVRRNLEKDLRKLKKLTEGN